MTIPAGPVPAKIVTHGESAFWHCPRCHRRLAEVTETAVVVRAGRLRDATGRQPGMTKACPCGCVSQL